ncbi:MAG: UDP-N-acetylmuramoyl-L-alanyl-D-glutamate--2,6-diaminopimelate ligase [Pirellulales bacterium]|jgi:UDP-N-acetylmuramoyl-L-alanyl-D-glutamate--2,6-diaminopimelate ligase|nr:UDP-N-acetylmuramoyl-L-alanyl-D-glutamate--2,6-diaminopimelate ligase [Thermoguttaceae bacterium]MDD4786313.1 UDP-N-acetylmuramoyl-L-alanyl-D-glutamate--2,6-diaminopimelate ligase [Pirellulales bacterium]NLZ00808.1 UDP-N-acetylmuramoyl-L-alanyl-D-glutamate--2,6-diaminopimelate ligase [Pirellulaceae bacterium]
MQVRPSGGQFVHLPEVLPEARDLESGAIACDAVQCDSRRVEPGDLFVAIRGTACDGHDYIHEAVGRGCAAVVVDRPVCVSPGVPVIVVEDTREAYGRICQRVVGNPSRQLKVIGITGTNGKTTTSCLVASVLSTAGFSTGLVGTLGAYDGETFGPSGQTTPPADHLARWLARMVRNGCSHAVLEVSSHALDQKRLAGIDLDAACVTNIRRDHLDYHQTLGNYRLAKSRIFDLLSGEGFAVANADDPASAACITAIGNPLLTVGIHSSAEISGVEIERFASEQTFLLSAGSETIPVRTKMIGTHHVYNCLVAAAVGLAYGIDLPTIVQGLEKVDHVPGRLERIECGQPFGVFVDYAHTPEALGSVLATLREVTAGRILCVFGAGGNRDREKRPLMGRAVRAGADLAIVTNDNPRDEDPEQIVREILAGVAGAAGAEVVFDRREAIGRALGAAEPGDCVLIAGKGHEACQIVGDRTLPLDDRQVARTWLYENQPFAEAIGDWGGR